MVIQARRLLKNWQELQATGVDAATGVPWTTQGALGEGTDITAASDGEGTVVDDKNKQPLALNLTAAVQSFAAGSPNYGWRLFTVSGGDQVEFFSSENVEALSRPKLLIVYETVPDAPSGLSATGSATQVSLSWTDNSVVETGYQLERKIGRTGSYSQIALLPANTTTYTDSAITPGVMHYYRVRGVNGWGDSAYSNEASAVAAAASASVTAAITDYAYDPFGNLIKTTDVKGNVTTVTYDLRGRKVGMADPDMGAWSYQYNVLGELISQTDAKAQTTSMVYDKLGRMIQRNEPDLVSTWTFDTCAKGVGKLCRATADNGYQRNHTYDALGRPATTSSTIDTTYVTALSYDAHGRIATQTYPTGFAVKHVYTALGYLAEVRNHATNALYWQANVMDAAGHLTRQTYGNGIVTNKIYQASSDRLTEILAGPGNAVQNISYQYDRLGNLSARHDYATVPAAPLSEYFDYDKLNRLIYHEQTSAAQGASARYLSFDAIGNILYKSDVGAYVFNPSGAGSVRPHAVIAIADVANATYTYDANGNLTGGAGRSVTYTSYNLPARIVQGSKQLDFTYDAEHQRSRQIGPDGTSIYLSPRYDAGLHFEKHTRPDGSIETRHYLYGGGQMIGQHTLTTPAGGGAALSQTRYFHHDPLGSIVALTDEAGAVVERLSYDAWGQRRNLDGSAGSGIEGGATHHGYTGHEMLDAVGLIHMNGRLYDPVLGRFMSADSYVQSPFDSQSYNRYAYCYNTPLTCTDPSGYFNLFKSIQKLWKKIWHSTVGRIAITVAVAWFTGDVISANLTSGAGTAGFTTTELIWLDANTKLAVVSLNTTGHVVVGSAAGFTGGLAGSGGDFQAGLKGAVSGGIAGGIGGYYGNEWSLGRVAANSVAGGVSSVINGGKFGDGFSLGFLSSSARIGWNSLRNWTDSYHLEGVYNPDRGEMQAVYNQWGELETAGPLLTKYAPGYQEGDETWLSRKFEMARPGAYSFGFTNPDTIIGRFINWVSKVHDPMNSWNYRGGSYYFQGPYHDLMFQALSVAGMLPAAAFTGVAQSAGSAVIYLRDSLRSRR